jgi:cytochrome c-type biogenesis protein
MPDLLVAATALWLGILTSISPCPLATNIAAISFVGRRLGSPLEVFWTGVVYTLGRMLTYVVLGILLVASFISVPLVSQLLQKYMNKILGPILILAGMFLLEMLTLRFASPGPSEKLQHRFASWGIWGAGLLGVIFALSFCPVSAALFFGSLLPLAIKYESRVLLPSLYGVATALPVLLFAIMVALGAQSLGKAFNKLTRIEWWARRITGTVFVVVGIYYSLTFIFGILT